MNTRYPVASLDARRYAETFAVFLRHSLEYPLMVAELVRVIREALRPDIRLLDIGAGTGCVVESLLAQPDIRLTRYAAFEPNPRHVDALQAVLRHLAIPATVHTEGFTGNTVVTDEFDLALFSHSLYWMADPAQVLLHAARSLAPGGVALALLQGPYGVHALFPLFEPQIERTTPMLQNNSLSSHELVAGLRAQGVEPEVRLLPTPVDLTDLFAPGAASDLGEFIAFCLQLEFTALPARLQADIVQHIRGGCVEQEGRLLWYLPNASVLVRRAALPPSLPR